jgi:SAM-dependent methyltransferase
LPESGGGGGREEWFQANRANWDERVPIHLKSYDLRALRAGSGRLTPIEESELRISPGERVLHLQCHFGQDTLTLAQRGASVVGLDFSAPAIAAARALAAELGFDPARAIFVEGNVYEAPSILAGQGGSFDLVYVSWGAINWLPDIGKWAAVVAHFLKPGGRFYMAEGHPAAFVFDDDSAAAATALPKWFVPYFGSSTGSRPWVGDDPRDYSDPNARLHNARTYEWLHPISEVLTQLLANGLRIELFHEHDAVPWRLFQCLLETEDGMFRWPREKWLPLAYSLIARKCEISEPAG